VCPSPTIEAELRRELEALEGVRVADLHVWELAPGRRSCMVSIVAETPRDTQFYRDHIHTRAELAHLTVEVHEARRGAPTPTPSTAPVG
jgi:Co/Zn/Cd efflux system component